MAENTRVSVKRGSTLNPDPKQAVTELKEQLAQDNLGGVLFFCSSKYDRDQLAEALDRSFDCEVAGCTTAGEIGPDGYIQAGLVGLSISSSEFKMHPRLITPLRGFGLQQAEQLATEFDRDCAGTHQADSARTFGLLFVDGMSKLEEQVIASLHAQFKGIEILGGSAGDDMEFHRTYVYHAGEFHSDAAILILCQTTLPHRIFRIQHFQPSEKRLVITHSDPEQRKVFEINGGPAADEYAALMDLDSEKLTPEIFAQHPVMLKVGGDYYVRSIQQVNPDKSISFYCAIDNGLVLRLAEGVDLLANLREQLAKLATEFSQLELIIGCDCILRRLEIQQAGIQAEVGHVLSEYNFVGFSTYGEQISGIHLNQTLTGVVLGS